MKNQNEITEEIGRCQIEIEQIDTKDKENIEQNVSKHKCLLAYQNALAWVINMKVPDQTE